MSSAYQTAKTEKSRTVTKDAIDSRHSERLSGMVVSRGEVHDRARLDRMLEETRRKVAENQ